jgi:anti-sigma28 factor (negative regulator of flagellin synthesis)
MDVKSIKAANIKKTHEKLKEQIQDKKDKAVENRSISINAASRIFGEVMESSIKKSLNNESNELRSGFGNDRKKSPGSARDGTGISARAAHYGGSREMNGITNIIMASPDIRINKANDIIRKINEGKYNADYLLIADKLLSHDITMRI